MNLPVVAAGAAALALSFGISVVLTPLVRGWALRRGFVDHPSGTGGHKQHKKPTSLGGGIAITVAILLPIVVALLVATVARRMGSEQLSVLPGWMPIWTPWLGGIAQKMPQALAVIFGALVMHLLGIVDDHRPLSPLFKLVVQIGVALLLAAGFGIRSGEALGVLPAVVLTTLWMVVLINAFNFMDNMDGLSAGVAGLTAIILAIAGFTAGQVFVPCVLLMIAGAALGFLFYNAPPASIFMGDAGSLVMGYMLAVCSILTTFYDPEQLRRPSGVLVPLVVFSIPLYDMASVIIQRYRLGLSIFRSDRRHFSHRLLKLGKGPRVAILTIYLATLATALPAILLPLLNWAGALLIFGQCLCVLAIIAILEFRDA